MWQTVGEGKVALECRVRGGGLEWKATSVEESEMGNQRTKKNERNSESMQINWMIGFWPTN